MLLAEIARTELQEVSTRQATDIDRLTKIGRPSHDEVRSDLVEKCNARLLNVGRSFDHTLLGSIKAVREDFRSRVGMIGTRDGRTLHRNVAVHSCEKVIALFATNLNVILSESGMIH